MSEAMGVSVGVTGVIVPVEVLDAVAVGSGVLDGVRVQVGTVVFVRVGVRDGTGEIDE